MYVCVRQHNKIVVVKDLSLYTENMILFSKIWISPQHIQIFTIGLDTFITYINKKIKMMAKSKIKKIDISIYCLHGVSRKELTYENTLYMNN